MPADELNAVPEAVRRYAEAPAAFNPNLPADLYVDDERFFLFFGRSPSVTLVMRVQLAGGNVAEAVTAVRELVRARGHGNACWSIGSSATPADLVVQLCAAGLELDDRAGNETHTTAMVFIGGSSPAPMGLAGARRVETYDEFVVAAKIDRLAFGIEDGWEEWLENAPALWERERSNNGPRVYLAFADGEAVGCARAIFDPDAVLLLGGGVLEHARGRGVYTSLVRARWEDACRAGTPALAVHAGAMSRPILQRLGFQPVSEITQLYDPATI